MRPNCRFLGFCRVIPRFRLRKSDVPQGSSEKFFIGPGCVKVLTKPSNGCKKKQKLRANRVFRTKLQKLFKTQRFWKRFLRCLSADARAWKETTRRLTQGPWNHFSLTTFTDSSTEVLRLKAIALFSMLPKDTKWKNHRSCETTLNSSFWK